MVEYKPKYVIEVFKTKKGEFAWRIRSTRNKKVVADSAETYKRRATCIRIVQSIQDNVYEADVVIL